MTPPSLQSGSLPSTSGARPWWVDPPDATAGARVAFKFTDSEKVLAARVARQAEIGHFRIPQIPEIAARAVALLAKPETESGEVSRLIHEDQQLAADVISFSNSSLFAGTTHNSNILQALGRVGFRRTRSLIFASSLRAVIYSGSELARAEALWRHACGCAAIASRVAQNLRQNADDLYLAGLFHDVGKPVVLSLIDTIAIRSQDSALRPGFIETLLDRHHERVGTEVARHWKLPEQVVEAVRCNVDSASRSPTKTQAIVTIANSVCWRLNIGETDDGRVIAGPPSLAALGASAEDIPRILEGVREAAGVV